MLTCNMVMQCDTIMWLTGSALVSNTINGRALLNALFLILEANYKNRVSRSLAQLPSYDY